MSEANVVSEQTVDWSSIADKPFNLDTLRIATQVRELAVQGVTIKNTFKAMNEVWLSLYTEDKRCLIVDQAATKVKYQLVNLYAVKLYKYLNSIVGLDLVPLSQQSPDVRTWKMDAVILNVSSRKITGHEDLFKLMMINLFGVNESLFDFAMEPTWEGLRQYVIKTYDIDFGDTEHAKGTPELEYVEGALDSYIRTPQLGYRPY